MACEPETDLKEEQPKRRNFHHGNLRADALAAALALVERDGPEALTLREVAKATGVNHRALYRHYPAKEDLAMAVAALGFADLAKAMRQTLTDASATQTSAHRLSAMNGYVRFALERPKLYALMFSLPGETFLRHPILAPAVAQVTDVCAEAFRRPSDPPGLSLILRDRVIALWGQAHGLIDLRQRGALRARNPKEAFDFITGLLSTRLSD